MIRLGLTLLAGFVFVGWYLGSTSAVNHTSDNQADQLVNQSMEGKDMSDQTAIFAAGCFWGVEATFRNVQGVRNTSVGYTGGHAANPTYKQVCSGKTGHAEAVRVIFNPEVVSYERLVEVFFTCHDPTTLNRQGPDIGTQYRSAIFYLDEGQRLNAVEVLDTIKASYSYKREVVTTVEQARTFYPAEEYHQQYLEKRGFNACLYQVGD